MACLCRVKILARVYILLLLFLMVLTWTSPALALRVISLYPGHSDNIVALGVADVLIGLSENDDADLLPELPRFPLKTGAEALLALQPDLVLTRGLVARLNPTLTQVLTQAGVHVESIDPPVWDNFPEYLRKLATILEIDTETGVMRFNTLRGSIASRAEEAKRAKSKINKTGIEPRVFLEATSKELHTCSPNSWAAHLIELAGGKNAAADAIPQREGTAIAPWGLERVLKLLDEGLDVYIIQQGAMNTSTLEDLKARPWAGVFNLKHKLAMVPERFLSRPSLLGLERGGEMLLKIFYDD